MIIITGVVNMAGVVRHWDDGREQAPQSVYHITNYHGAPLDDLPDAEEYSGEPASTWYSFEKEGRVF